MLKHADGGSIGLRASGAVAKIVMQIWIRIFSDKLERANRSTGKISHDGDNKVDTVEWKYNDGALPSGFTKSTVS